MPERLLLNVRGTSGAGKTFLVRQFLSNYLVEYLPRTGDRKNGGFPGAAKVNIPDLKFPIYFLGKYSADGCGGMDTIYSQEESVKWALHFIAQGHVICEGLLTSGLGPGGIFCKTVMSTIPEAVRFLFLDTSLEQCIANVNLRRQARGNMEVFTDAKRHLTKKHMQIQNVIRTMANLQWPVFMLNHEVGFQQVLQILQEAENVSRQTSS